MVSALWVISGRILELAPSQLRSEGSISTTSDDGGIGEFLWGSIGQRARWWADVCVDFCPSRLRYTDIAVGESDEISSRRITKDFMDFPYSLSSTRVHEGGYCYKEEVRLPKATAHRGDEINENS